MDSVIGVDVRVLSVHVCDVLFKCSTCLSRSSYRPIRCAVDHTVDCIYRCS